MRLFGGFLLCATAALFLASPHSAAAAELSEADKIVAQKLKREAVTALEDEVAKRDQLVRQARVQKSPQLREVVTQLEESRKKLATAKRKPLEDYFADRKPSEPAKENKTPEGLPLGVAGNEGLSVVFPYTIAYIPQGGEAFDFSFILAAFDGMKPTEGFVDVSGKPTKVEAVSSDDTIVEVKPDPKFTLSPFVCRFRRPGEVTVTVSAGAYSVEQTVEVLEIPVNAQAPSSDVIEQMGFPTEKKKVYVTWPEDKFVDCFMYSPEAGKPFIGEHWTFEKYPSLVLSIEEGTLRGVGTRKLNNASRAAHSVPTPNVEGVRRPAIQ